MAALSIRDLDDAVKEKLRVRAAQNGRSMEAEVRSILADAVEESSEPKNFGLALYEAFQAVGGVDLDLPARSQQHRPLPEFS